MDANQSIIDKAVLGEAKELMGDRFPKMIQYFIEDTKTYMNEINNAINIDEAAKALGPAHTLKSSAKQLGAERVSELAKNIEEVCRNLVDNGTTNSSQLLLLYKELEAEIPLTIEELKNYLMK